jgi:hypothetical protein
LTRGGFDYMISELGGLISEVHTWLFLAVLFL